MAQQNERYTPEQVQAILERALARKKGDDVTGITHNDLLETARELDIHEGDLEAAIRDYEETYLLDEAKEEWKVRRKQKFFEHLRVYLIVNFVLAVIDLVTSGGTWFFWPLFGWGIGVAFDAAEAFYPKQGDIERGAERLIRKDRKLRDHVRKHEEFRQQMHEPVSKKFSRQVVIDSKKGKIIIEKGDRRIEIG